MHSVCILATLLQSLNHVPILLSDHYRKLAFTNMLYLTHHPRAGVLGKGGTKLNQDRLQVSSAF